MSSPRPTPDALTMASFALLGVLAVLLLIPLVTGGPPPSPYLIAGLLVLRLGLQFLRSRHDERLRRPASWAFDVLLIGLIFYVAGNQPA
ncbi:hypothetical protein GCM10010840_21540 [Deinococcus aerolatus]|uniref:DUF3017 domain-containing protein n=1 Tax=Deinococcus aerolatus TaxID=522487 RepID=A0ABQ2GB49_9DEIO|nr:hypothetical protein [Deinococcus aerolatus]GGL83478.1 hypothetical protein GCM10010840_21540 [Deinococcus aerolatus]